MVTSRIAVLGCLVIVAGIHAVTGNARAQSCAELFNMSQVLDLHLTMAPQDWDSLRTSCFGGACPPPPHSFFPAFLECGNTGPIFVGVRRKNGLAEPTETNPQKVALKIDIDEFMGGQRFFGKKKLSLENGSDGALVTEGLAWNIFQRADIVTCRAAWVNVYVNGDYKGLYVNVEQIDKTFLSDHGVDNDGFLFKVRDQRTRESETNPFAFNWYPFDHPTSPPEVTPPVDWRVQAVVRVNMSHLLKLAVTENFVANSDGVVQKMTNYWYYDWSILPNDDPAGRQPRLYLAWDLDTTMKNNQTQMPITESGPGHLQQGLIDELDEAGVPFAEPTFQEAYLAAYRALLDGSLALSEMFALLNQVEAVIGPHMDADPYQQIGPAATEFQRVREFLQERAAFVRSQLTPGTWGDSDGDDDVDLFDFAALARCFTGDTPAECATTSCADVFDVDGDCDVDTTDYGEIHPSLHGPSK